MNLTYDALGNILTKNVGANSMNYTSYDPVKVHAVKTLNFNGTAYTFNYDNDGNMTTGYDFTDPANVASRTMTYDDDNNLASVAYTKGGSSVSATMSYDEGGTRVKKVGSSTTYYVSDVYEVKDGVATKYITAGNLKLAVVSNNVTYYYHNDHLGSSAVMTDATGTVVEKTEYMPFGAVREHTGNSVTNYKYTGQELDPESGLYYYKSRYYDNVLARFISPDSIYSDLYIPQELNGYAYCANNPINNVDPDGHSIESIIVTAVVCAVISAVTAGHASGGDSSAVFKGAIVGGVSGAVFGALGGPAGYLLSSAIVSNLFTANIIAGIAAGAVAGGLNAAFYGNNIGQGMLQGAAIGGATVLVVEAIGAAINWAVNNNQMAISTTSKLSDTRNLDTSLAGDDKTAIYEAWKNAKLRFLENFNQCMNNNYNSYQWYRWSTQGSLLNWGNLLNEGISMVEEGAATFSVGTAAGGGWFLNSIVNPGAQADWLLTLGRFSINAVKFSGTATLGYSVFGTFLEGTARTYCTSEALGETFIW